MESKSVGSDELQIFEGQVDLPEVATATPQYFMFRFGPFRGKAIGRVTSSAFKSNTYAWVSICEGSSETNRWVGGAKYTLHNVAPADGKIDVWMEIDWGSPLICYASFVYFTP